MTKISQGKQQDNINIKIPETNNEVVVPTVSVVQLALFREVPSTSH